VHHAHRAHHPVRRALRLRHRQHPDPVAHLHSRGPVHPRFGREGARVPPPHQEGPGGPHAQMARTGHHHEELVHPRLERHPARDLGVRGVLREERPQPHRRLPQGQPHPHRRRDPQQELRRDLPLQRGVHGRRRGRHEGPCGPARHGTAPDATGRHRERGQGRVHRGFHQAHEPGHARRRPRALRHPRLARAHRPVPAPLLVLRRGGRAGLLRELRLQPGADPPPDEEPERVPGPGGGGHGGGVRTQ